MIQMRISSAKKLASVLLRVLQSRKFFLVIVGLLVVQAAWTALIARYPMAFDENFHFGIIQIYSHQWTPFFSHDPASAAPYGDLVRNPSYLYHYLMSFPYRLIAAFIHGQTAQIIILRFINIGIFAAGLFVFRSLLLRLKLSAGIVHLSLLMLVLIPVVPFLASQINYDNLTFLVVAVATLLTLTCGQAIVKNGTLPATRFLSLLIVCFLGSLVKYPFLPVFFALFLYLIILITVRKKWRVVFPRLFSSFLALRLWLKISLVVALLISGGLFAERYGINIIQYKSVQPDCAKFASVSYCKQYGPWARNHAIATANQTALEKAPLDPHPAFFLPEWLYGMMHRLYFAINYNYINYYELPIPTITASVVGLFGVIFFLVFCRSLLKANPQLFLLIGVILIYVASLLYVNFTDYLHYRTMLAINGRYLILVFPLFFALIALGYKAFFHKISPGRATSYKLGFTVVILLLTLQGGGVLTYIVRSDTSWYWQNKAAVQASQTAKNIVTPFILGAGERKQSL